MRQITCAVRRANHEIHILIRKEPVIWRVPSLYMGSGRGYFRLRRLRKRRKRKYRPSARFIVFMIWARLSMSKTISTASRTNFFIGLPPWRRASKVVKGRREGLVVRDYNVAVVSPCRDVDAVVAPLKLFPVETKTSVGRNAEPTV